MIKWNTAAWVAPLTLLALAAPLGAQEPRAAFIERSRNEFDEAERLDLLLSALSPELERPDSLWAVAAYDLAQVLLSADEPLLASVWLRFAARHAPEWPIDRTWYPPSVVQAYEEARSAVDGKPGSDDAAVRTEWRWPARFDVASRGTVEVTSVVPSVPLSVMVQGIGIVEPGSVLDVSPGTYELVASAEGYESTRLTREVLPGVATIVAFDLAPALSSQVRGIASGRLVRITAAVVILGLVIVIGVL